MTIIIVIDIFNRLILTGVLVWSFQCRKQNNGIPEAFASVPNALCFIDYATKCRHGSLYKNFYDYEEYCHDWIDKTIDDLTKEGPEKSRELEKARELKASCVY